MRNPNPAHAPAAFDPDHHSARAVALHLDARDNAVELPVHRHRRGQLVIARRGFVTCLVESGVWVVPHHCGVWIPGGVAHSNRVAANGEITVLFVEPGAARMPQHCCTFAIPPLIRELIAHLAERPHDYEEDSATGRLAAVLLEQLGGMPLEQLHLPMSPKRQLRRIAAALLKDPSNRATVAQWAAQVALSERSLARLVMAETGLSFGRWRRQLHIVVAIQRLSTGLPVQRVAAELGYESVNAFITMFKKVLGKTPGHYLPRAAQARDDTHRS
ncbi:AraC family transcriptional regulator [Burkholderia gladioli]|uniref:AraC family transcriptional regulator n=1 Tax=Burkholderia gladioli TaxID=28095 RepID=UPI0023640268|nr:helix-turn-helix transcriptional regulator [Burkholderia gladioli]MDD1787523.1 helix-turn-helix transcriptional regulator [Burkholderia gladioli]